MTFIILIGAFGTFEWIIRQEGFVPSVSDDARLWAVQRAQVPENDPNAIVLLGSSRSLCGMNLDALETTLGTKPIQLAGIGSSPVPILKHLAEESDFKGLILCEVTPRLFYSKHRNKHPERVLGTYASVQSSLFGLTERRLSVAVESYIVSLSSALQLEELIKALIRQQWPIPNRTVQANRQCNFNPWKQEHFPPPPSPPFSKSPKLSNTEREIIAEVKGYIDTLRQRGGDVIFKYIPSSGKQREMEERYYPRDPYWYTLLSETNTRGIHSDDEPTLASFQPHADDSHLDFDDAESFSRNLGQVIKTRMEQP